MVANKSLTEANLSNNAFEHDASRQLGEMLGSRLNTMTSLDLSGNDIDGDRSIADALHENDALTSINLNDNPLGPMAGHAFGLALKRSTNKLRALDLRGCALGVEGGKSLASAF